MKSKDLTLIAVIGLASAIIALVVSNIFLAAPKDLKADVEVVQEITAEFPFPNKKYFNENSENPTRLIQIRENQTANPFTNQQQ